MKRNFKFKALVLSMIVMMGLTLVPSLYAYTAAELNDMKFVNAEGVTEENAEAVMSYMVDKTTLTPGDVITLTVSLDKLPSNGNGIVAISSRIAYDTSKLEVLLSDTDGNILEDANYTDGTDGVCVYVEPGVVGSKLNLTLASCGVVKNDEQKNPLPENINMISMGATNTVGFQAKITGDVYKLKFKVKENASGDIALAVVKGGTKYNGLKISGVEKNPTTGKLAPKEIDDLFVKTNLDGMKIPVPATGIEFVGIDSVDLDMSNAKSMDLSSYVKLTPSNTTDDMTWEITGDTTVATVSNGVVTGLKNGTTEVTVTCGNFSAKLPITVTTSPKTMSFGNAKYTVNFEETRNLKDEVTVGPADAIYDAADMVWSSDNTAVATVDAATGVVTGVSKGTANITVKLGNLTATVPVTVTVPLKSISIDKTEVVIYKGEEVKVTVTANPAGAEWETLVGSFDSGAQFAEVKEVADGIVITGKAEGTAVVAISVNGNATGDLYKLVNVTVKENNVTGVTIDNEAGAELLRGETLEMTGSYTVEDDTHEATDDVTKKWESLNPEIATIDENGVVTAVKEGTATIRLTIAGQTADYTVTVKEIHVDGIVFDEKTIEDLDALEELTVGDVLKVPFTLDPEGTITDTVEEILEFILLDYDKDLVDVEVEYNKETGKGMITITTKAAGDVEVIITEGDYETDVNAMLYAIAFRTVEPVKEEEELPETGDMPVAMLAVMMGVSVIGLVASKKVFVK